MIIDTVIKSLYHHKGQAKLVFADFLEENNDPLCDIARAQARNELSCGKVVAWGYGDRGQCNIPESLKDVIAVSAAVSGGFLNSIALTKEGRIVVWGSQRAIKELQEVIIAISAGSEYYFPVLTKEGKVLNLLPHYFNMPPDVIAIHAGPDHFLALTKAGKVAAWGYNYYGQCDVPTDLKDVVAISSGDQHSLALTKEGTVIGWGDDSSRQCSAPKDLNNVIAIAAGGYHSLALTKEGTVVGWGDNYTRQCNVPTDLKDVVAISAGCYHSLALTKEGKVVAWGNNSYRQCNVPKNLKNVIAISAAENHSLAITTEP